MEGESVSDAVVALIWVVVVEGAFVAEMVVMAPVWVAMVGGEAVSDVAKATVLAGTKIFGPKINMPNKRKIIIGDAER